MGDDMRVAARALQIELPRTSTPGASYVPFMRAGDLVFLVEVE